MFGHYTSQTGLMGIISNETLWATNINFLNDEHEFQHALNLIRDIIPTSNITPDMKDHSIYVKYRKQIEKALKTLGEYTSESIFTLSFSKETDLLSQWRGYCSDNKGYCLVFDVNGVHEKVKELYKDSYLVDCVYDKEKKESQIRKLLNSYWTQYNTKMDDDAKKNVINDLVKEIMLLASYFKHPSFSEEKEKRIVINLDSTENNNLKFREGIFSLIPYIELKASKEYLKRICIGPTFNKKLSKKSVEMFLEKTYGYPPELLGNIKVAYSETPYRSW